MNELDSVFDVIQLQIDRQNKHRNNSIEPRHVQNLLLIAKKVKQISECAYPSRQIQQIENSYKQMKEMYTNG